MDSATKIKALAKHLEVDSEHIFEEDYGDEKIFGYGNQQYLVVTEEEREKVIKDDIKGSLWAFNADFILNHTKIDSNERIVKAFKRVQEELCEDANDIVEALIEDIDEFIEDAIEADGYGHFLARYDGEEIELDVEDGEEDLYAYRVN